MTYSVYNGPAWVVDLEAESMEEAIEKGQQVDPKADTAEPAQNIKII